MHDAGWKMEMKRETTEYVRKVATYAATAVPRPTGRNS